MSNNITIELCAEDRARLDRLAEVIERRIAQVAGIIAERDGANTPETKTQAEAGTPETTNTETEAPAESPTEATGEAEALTPTETQPNEEKPEAPTETKPQPTVTLEQIQQKVVQLAAGNGGAKKAQVREIISTYGTKVSDLKEQPDKWDEVWNKLTALENEG